MKAGGTPQWGRRGIVSVVAGWCALAVLAVAMRLKRFARLAAAAPPLQTVTRTQPQKPQAPIAPALSAKVRRESGEVNARFVFAIVFGWFVFLFIGLAFLMHTYESTPPFPKPPPDSSYPAPRLVLHPFALEPPYLAAQQQALATGAMPIARAMAEIAARPDPYAPIGTEDVHGH
ncbi:MAG: hypothetical protein ACREHF_08990 [Rhizomicrobium sp.]